MVLVFCAGSSRAFWFFAQETTEAPRETRGTTGSTTTNAGSIKAKETKENITLSRVGEEIINVATGIQKFVKDWDATPTTWTTTEADTKKTEKPHWMGKTGRFRDSFLIKGSRGVLRY